MSKGICASNSGPFEHRIGTCGRMSADAHIGHIRGGDAPVPAFAEL